MLYLTRKIGESVMIGNNVEVTVMEVRGRTVKLGFVFPSDVSILRKELHDRIQQQNIAAASGGDLGDIEFDMNINGKDDNHGNR